MNIVVGVTGGIAAYKACDLILGLQKTGHEVRVIMTDNATQFVTPITLATLSKHPVMRDMWIESKDVEHIEVSKWAEIFVVYPATANIIAKFANGIADDTLSTVYLALPKGTHIFVFPAMNTNMYRHIATKRNMATLERDEVWVAKTRETVLACGDRGEGGVLKPRDAVKLINDVTKNQE
jgi:phosphopantothenoylcysteine decarboxylase